MPNPKTAPTLDTALCDAIQKWRDAYNPELSILETLSSIENVRHLLTEIWLEKRGLKQES